MHSSWYSRKTSLGCVAGGDGGGGKEEVEDEDNVVFALRAETIEARLNPAGADVEATCLNSFSAW